MTEMVKVTIDGRECEALAGELLVKVAQDNGVYIPRFCWHERLKPVGMCRACLVEIEGVRGFPPSCTTPVTDGMVVHTQSDAVKKIQDGVLELLLVNHPLDCPVCDRGGECPLQDQTLAFGPGESRFVEEKRHYEKPIPISDLVLLDRERCIQCARCTRFADEIAGDPLITFVERGGRTQVLTYPDQPFISYFSGNTVQICPVGALTSKQYRFKARPWDLATVETSCTACSVQCRGALQSSSNRVVRFLGVDSEPVNHGWLCDKGRYGIEYLHSPDRILSPRVNSGGELTEMSWPQALDSAAAELRKAIDLHGPGSIAVLGGARGTNEDAYVWARFAKGVLRTDNVDAQLGDGLPADVVLGLPRAEISDCDHAAAVVLLAPDLKEELPVLYLRLRRAAAELGVPIIDLSASDHGLSPYVSAALRPVPGEQGSTAERLAAAVASGEESGDASVDAAAALIRGREGRVVVVLGRPSLAERADVTVRAASALASMPNVAFLSALRRGNVHGALDLGLAPGFLPGRVSLDAGRERFTSAWGGVPDAPGLGAEGILRAAADGKMRVLVLVGADPLGDFPDRALARAGLDGAGTVIAVDAFLSESARRADVFLPCTLWGEKAGSVTNLEGRVQRVGRKISPEGTAMDEWRIAGELAARLGADFDLEAVDEVTDEIARLAPAHHGATAALLRHARDGAVLPLAEHLGEVVWRRGAMTIQAEDGSGTSWDPIRVGGEAAAVSDVEQADAAAALEDGEDGEGGTEGGAGGAVVAEPPPDLHVWDRAFAPAEVPARDAYALRLVTGRTLYDHGRAVALSGAVAGLAGEPELLVSATDLARLGVDDGGQVRVTSAKATITIAVRAAAGVPQGVARLAFGADGTRAQELIDAAAHVIDLRVETVR